MALNVQNTKIELIQWLTTVDDIDVLKKLLDFRNSSTYELSEAERKSIEEGLEDLKNGEVIPHSEAKKTYEKWL
ncbi:MAG: hypothetical protein K9G46_04000 [Flavobacteriales bacterium]|jgi:hypothetical protein|nr:hypothetical protein [Flavobacteriales bacterium]